MKQSRKYRSDIRRQAAKETKQRIVDSSRKLFSKRGIDKVTIGEIAARARVAQSTVYEVFGSKTGILREIFMQTIFGTRYEAAMLKLRGESDPRELFKLVARVARTVYEDEVREIGLLQGASMFSPELKQLQREIEDSRYEIQRPIVEALFANSRVPRGLTLEAARQLLWMYTSRDVYRMLVVESRWTPDQYECWLADALRAELVAPE